MQKICIWCRKEEPAVSFTRLAHIFPQSLGGKRTCQNVCDDCNLYFGSKQTGLPSVEIALKEPLNISRLYLISQLNKKSKPPRFKSGKANFERSFLIFFEFDKFEVSKNGELEFIINGKVFMRVNTIQQEDKRIYFQQWKADFYKKKNYWQTDLFANSDIDREWSRIKTDFHFIE